MHVARIDTRRTIKNNQKERRNRRRRHKYRDKCEGEAEK